MIRIFGTWVFSAVVMAAVAWSWTPPASAADPREIFEAAAKMYEEGRFSEAVAAYDQLLTNNVATAAVLFNQGNAWLKLGRVGLAITRYRQAQRLDPRDPGVAANLRFARSKIVGAAPAPGNWATWVLGVLRPGEWAAGALLLNGLAGGLLLARECYSKIRDRTTGLATWIAVVALGVLVAAAMARFVDGRPMAVVISESAARFGPLEESQAAFTLPDGAELRVTDHARNWFELRDSTGRSGWVPQTNVVVLGRLN